MASTITDQFNKAKNLSLTVSMICFVVSNIASDNFAKLNLFGVELSQLNARFVIYSLALASVISIISLYLAYNNEISDAVKTKNNIISVETISSDIISAIKDSKNTITRLSSDFEKYLANSSLNDYLADCVPIVDDIRLVEQVERVINDAEIAQAIAVLKKTITDNVDFDPTSVQYQDFATVDFPRAADFILAKMQSLKGNMWTNQPPEYAYTARRLTEMAWWQKRLQDEFLVKLDSLSVQVKKQRQAMKLESIYLNTEAKVFGLIIPTVVFMISIYHAANKLSGSNLRTLPEIFG